MAQEGVDKVEPKREFEFKVSKLEGSPASEHGRFVQVFEFVPQEDEDFPKDRGRLFAVIDLTVVPGSDVALAAKLVWGALTGGYYDPSEETPIKALEEAVYAARDRLQDFAQGSTLNLLAVALWGDVAYFARIGKPALYLRRGSEVRDLLTEDGAVDIGSQNLEKDDVLVAGSPVFGKNFTAKTLPQTEFLKKQFEGGETVPGFAALLLRTESSVEEREVEVEKSKSGRAAFAKTAASAAAASKKAVKSVSKINVKSLSPTKVKEAVSSALSSRLKHGEEISQAKKTQEQEAPKPQKPQEKPAKKGKLPKISLPFGREVLPRLTIILVVILVASVAFTTWRQAQKAKVEEFDNLIASVTSSLDEAEGLVGLSNERAKELLDEARSNVVSAESLFPDSEEVDPLLTRADSLFNAIEKITPVEEKHSVYDLGLKVEGAEGLALTGSGSTVYVVDKTSGSLFAVKMGELPQASVLGEGKLSGIRDLVQESGYLYILADDTIYRLRLSNKKIDEPITFDRYGKTTAISTYLGNIYLLVPGEDQIYKFWNLSGGYAKAQGWVKEAINLGSVVDFAIDGEIWMLEINGELIRLSKGKRETFALSNLSTPFDQTIKIFTRPNLKRLYVLDQGNQRVVVLDKGGEFVRQFKGDMLTDLKDLWVSDNEKSLYILSGSKIYRLGL